VDLVERDEMLAVIDRLFRDCCQGNGKVAVISGPVGIGKTEFLHTVATRMRGFGAHLLYAGVPRAEYGCSLGAVDQLLRNASLPRIFVERLTKLLDAALGAVVDPAQSGVDGQERPDSAVIRGRWHAELWDVVRELADDQPLVVIIDDAHNLD
jgi:Cdc6-like AAA superfamily ATPase